MVRLPSVERATQYAAMVLSIGGRGWLRFIGPAWCSNRLWRVFLLAGEANRHVVEELRGSINKQEDALARQDYHTALAEINRFHEVLMRGSGNLVLTFLVGMLHLLSHSTSAFLMEGSVAGTTELHVADQKLDPDRRPYTIVIGMRSWLKPAFADLRRRHPGAKS